MAEMIYNLKQVSYGYPKSLPVLSDICLQIYRGEKIVILGANGCGKSTLLKILGGLLFPTRGQIEAFGQILNEKKLEDDPYPFRKRVGLVFQDSDTQLFCSSVFDELAFAPLQLQMDNECLKHQVDTVLKDFGLEELKGRPPYRLSGGEKKKVALAAVSIYNPEVFILDEPTNNLDPRTQRWFRGKLEELNRNGTTLIIATHDLEMAKQIADRVIVMNEQHGIESDGKPEDIFADEQLLLKVNLI
jgi:cobalt/nickel transport system ATP-binding protein